MRAVPVLCLMLPGSAAAETLWVAEGGESPFTDIQDAIDAAVDGDLVLVLPGTYGPVDLAGKDLVVRSTGGASITLIDAQGVGSAAFLHGAEPETALLHGFTLTGGVGTPDETFLVAVGGGVVVTRGSAARVSGNVIEGNSAVTGGGIAVTGGFGAIYGNVVRDNLAVGGAGGVFVGAAAGFPGGPLIACNDIRGNVGGTVGGMLLQSPFDARNNAVHGNTGERGGAWFVGDATGNFEQNTVTANVSQPTSAAGVHADVSGVSFAGNLVANNAVGFGALLSDLSIAWAWNDVDGNAAGAYSGPGGSRTGTAGNVEIAPSFVAFTPADPFDDVLNLAPTDPLRNLGDPALLDLDGSRAGIGLDGGPMEECDEDGDGVRASDVPADCRPNEGGFHPGADERAFGLDADCDGWAAVQSVDLVLDDGGFTPSGDWSFAPPLAAPGRGHQGVQSWCAGCATPLASGGGDLVAPVDLAALPAATPSRLRAVLAWDGAVGADGLAVELDAGAGFAPAPPIGDYPYGSTLGAGNVLAGQVPLGVFSGEAGWTVVDFDTTALSGGTGQARFRVGVATGSSAAFALGRLTLLVVDADGDGRGASVTDCDDAVVDTYDGAPEVPYDSIDQDCDGADLVDVDGDGYAAVQAGGADCDDAALDVFPGGIEAPYDGIDQDCSGLDLIDVDGDGWVSEAVDGGDDCDDENAAAFPGAEEIPYDGIDQDCDGADEVDVDGDGAAGDEGPPFGDCDDFDPDVHPGAAEVCDGVDQDCDGGVDFIPDGDGDAVFACFGDCDDADPAVFTGAPEICNGKDDDCDGVTEDGEVDADGDSAFVCAGDCDDADPLRAAAFPEVCDGVDNDCDHGVDEGQDRDGDGFSGCTTDCDDQRSTVYPGADLQCATNLDGDCDGTRDFQEPECASTGGGCGGGAAFLPFLLVLPYRSRRSQAAPGIGAPPPR